MREELIDLVQPDVGEYSPPVKSKKGNRQESKSASRLNQHSAKQTPKPKAANLNYSSTKTGKYIVSRQVNAPSPKNERQEIENTPEWVMYRRRFGLDKKTKIFICKQYMTFKKALLERGWHENTDANSTVFHLKFTIKRDSIYGPCVSQQNNENYI